jgi:hypothetical protein
VSQLTEPEIELFVRDCESLRDDFVGLVGDRRLVSWKHNVRYAIDFSELYAYVFPDKAAEQLKIFSQDTESVTRAVQEYVLNKLMFNWEQKLILLPTYAVELRSFVEFVREQSVFEHVSMAPKALQEVEDRAKDPEFRRVEALVAGSYRDSTDLSDPEWDEILRFLESRAPGLVRLSYGRETEPLERLGMLLRKAGFEPLAALVDTAGSIDEPTVQAWARELEAQRRQRSASNYLDALSVEQVNAANHLLQREHIHIRLITRSSNMRRVESRFGPGSDDEFGQSSILRHPRAFFALRRAEGQTDTQLLDRLFMMLTTLEAVIVSYQQRRETHPARANLAEVSQLIDEIRQLLHGGANLASVVAVAEASDANQPSLAQPTQDVRERVLRLFAMLRDETSLLGRLEEKTRELAESIDRSQQLLAIALQGQPDEVWASNQRAVQYQVEGGTTVIKSTLYWMPYTLEFKDPELQQWSREFEQSGAMSLSQMLDRFKSGFSKNLDYEMLLSLAYMLAAWGQWDLGLKYADLALTTERQNPQVTANEGKFFKALCLRMIGSKNADRYKEAEELLDQAQAIKGNDAANRDARYLKEKATLLFYWGDISPSPEGVQKSERAAALCKEALEIAGSDQAIKLQLYNNLCYYFTNYPTRATAGESQYYLELLEGELDQSTPGTWPINFVDTVLCAHCQRPGHQLDEPYIRRLVAALDDALSGQRIADVDRQSMLAHTKAAKQRLRASESREKRAPTPPLR